MQPPPEFLPSDPQALQNLVLDLQARLVERDAQIDQLNQRFQALIEEFRLAQQRQFGQSSESADQLGLFNESEAIVETEAEPAGLGDQPYWQLYRIESEIKAMAPGEKYRQRQERAKPLLDELKTWLDKSVNQVPPKTALGKAIASSLGQWVKLVRYLEDGNLQIDNNRVERAVKPFVIGGKNWFIANTGNGARASAILYSLVETAKTNGLMPFDYLQLLLDNLPATSEDVDRLLPWNVDLPCRMDN